VEVAGDAAEGRARRWVGRTWCCRRASKKVGGAQAANGCPVWWLGCLVVGAPQSVASSSAGLAKRTPNTRPGLQRRKREDAPGAACSQEQQPGAGGGAACSQRQQSGAGAACARVQQQQRQRHYFPACVAPHRFRQASLCALDPVSEYQKWAPFPSLCQWYTWPFPDLNHLMFAPPMCYTIYQEPPSTCGPSCNRQWATTVKLEKQCWSSNTSSNPWGDEVCYQLLQPSTVQFSIAPLHSVLCDLFKPMLGVFVWVADRQYIGRESHELECTRHLWAWKQLWSRHVPQEKKKLQECCVRFWGCVTDWWSIKLCCSRPGGCLNWLDEYFTWWHFLATAVFWA